MASYLVSGVPQTACARRAPARRRTRVVRVAADGGLVDVLQSLGNLVKDNIPSIGGVAVVGGTVVYRKARQKLIQQASKSKLKQNEPVQVAPLFPRRAVQEELRAILTPARHVALYSVITGRAGSGKSSEVAAACNGVEGDGLLYVSVTSPDNFADAVARAVGWEEGPRGAFQAIAGLLQAAGAAGAQEEASNRWPKVRDALEAAACQYVEEENRIPVMVIDDAGSLAGSSPDAPCLLCELQACAKRWADKGILRVVFVLGEGDSLNLLRSHPLWATADFPYEVPDFTPEEAAAYLTQAGVREEVLGPVRELVGGRVGLLKLAAGKLKGERPMERLPRFKEGLMCNAEAELARAGLLSGSPQRQAGRVLAQELLDAPGGAIPFRRAAELVPDPAWQKELFGAPRVFAVHAASRAVTFYSQPVAVYARERLLHAPAPALPHALHANGATLPLANK